MVSLHIYLDVSRENVESFIQLYWLDYLPAIETQAGFIRSELLQKLDQTAFEIDIYFESEALRQQWAASVDHERVWPKVQQLADRIEWEGFSILEQ